MCSKFADWGILFGVIFLRFAEVVGSVSSSNSLNFVPPCESFNFSISVQASVDSGVSLPAATYQISASYCPPTVFIPSRSRTVQLLLHGATANKYYWSALGPVGMYSLPVVFIRYQTPLFCVCNSKFNPPKATLISLHEFR